MAEIMSRMMERCRQLWTACGRARQPAAAVGLLLVTLAVIALFVQTCHRPGKTTFPVQTGYASYYHPSLEGELTASGDRYRPGALTAAHRELPLESRVRVTNLANDKWVIVTVNDRGPVPHDRIIDLSRRAARLLGILEQGVARVRLEVLDKPPRDE